MYKCVRLFFDVSKRATATKTLSTATSFLTLQTILAGTLQTILAGIVTRTSSTPAAHQQSSDPAIQPHKP
jgi:hypothetical protein